MKTFLCEKCRRSDWVRSEKEEPYIYDDNIIKTSFSRCFHCRFPYFYIVKKSTEEIIFPYSGKYLIHGLTAIGDIFSSYSPIVEMQEENKEFILRTRKPGDLTIGFYGWEDYVIEKSLAGEWYYTVNTPPSLDAIIGSIIRNSLGSHKVFLSYFPSLLLDNLGIQYYLIKERNADSFKNFRTSMLDRYTNLHVGIKRKK
jgi:hypothetical protein